MRESKFYKIGAAVLIMLSVVFIVFIILGKKADKNLSKTNENPTSVSSSNVIEQNISEKQLKELEEIQENKTDETSANTVSQNQIKPNEEAINKNTNTNELNKINQENNRQDDIIEDPVFSYPVDGDIMTEYAKDKLVFSNTLGEWITHLGVDIKAEKTALVKASAAGTIKAIKNDPRFGLTVIIEHVNGYDTVYSNLLTAEFISVGENVSSGQSIGTVGNTASFEILDEPHLHFEILKNNEQIDPTMYLKK